MFFSNILRDILPNARVLRKYNPPFGLVADDVMLHAHVPHPPATEATLGYSHRSLVVFVGLDGLVNRGCHEFFYLSEFVPYFG